MEDFLKTGIDRTASMEENLDKMYASMGLNATRRKFWVDYMCGNEVDITSNKEALRDEIMFLAAVNLAEGRIEFRKAFGWVPIEQKQH